MALAVKDFVRKPAAVRGVQFTALNGEEIANALEECTWTPAGEGPGQLYFNGDRVCLGEWIIDVDPPNGEYRVWPNTAIALGYDLA